MSADIENVYLTEPFGEKFYTRAGQNLDRTKEV